MASRARVLVDTGPLVAFLRSSEASHEWVKEQFAELPAPFYTCEPVLAEALFLLSRHHDGPRRFFELMATGLLQVEFSIQAEQASLAKLISKYRELPMSLADACLLRMAEQHEGSVVFTLDRHFRVYRKNGRQILPVLMPEQRSSPGVP